MSDLELIESLCRIVEQEIGIIRKLTYALSQERALTEAEKMYVRDSENSYSEVIDHISDLP